MKRTIHFITGKSNLLTATCLQKSIPHPVGFLIDCFSKEFAIDATITSRTMSQLNIHTEMTESYRMRTHN